MSKGYVYIMTTAVDGIIKIGNSKDWTKRCQYTLEGNGYKNMNSLKTYFVAECEEYLEIESIMHDIFRESQVSNTELFAIDKDRAKHVLSKMGKQVYPEENNTTVKTKNETVKTKNETDATIYNYNFWLALDKELDKYSILPENKSTAIHNRYYYTPGRLNLKNGWHIGFALDRKRGNVINISVATTNPNSFNHYDIYKSHKNEIEKELGFSLYWDYKFEGVNNSLKKRIIYFIDADFSTIDKEIIKNVVDIAVKMYTVFLKYS